MASTFAVDRNYSPYRPILKKEHRKTAQNLKVVFADEVPGGRDLVSVKEYKPYRRNRMPSRYSFDIVAKYRAFCIMKSFDILDPIVAQLQRIKNNENYSAVLNLYGIAMTHEVLESLEVIFQMVKFRALNVYLNCFSRPAVTDFFEIITFYEPAKELVLSDFPELFNEFIWDVLSYSLKQSKTVNFLWFRKIHKVDQEFGNFLSFLSTRSSISTLLIDGCKLNTRLEFDMGRTLFRNCHIKTLRLGHANLGRLDGDNFRKYIAFNSVLQVLDLSSNKVDDHFLYKIAGALCLQAYRGVSIQSLTLAGNCLTKNCAASLRKILAECTLKTLDLGFNGLFDAFLFLIKEELSNSKSLTSLGLRFTFISFIGIYHLIEACVRNKNLRHLDLRTNKRLTARALDALTDVVPFTSLTNIEVDRVNTYCRDVNKYTESAEKLQNSVKLNKARLLFLYETQIPNSMPDIIRVHRIHEMSCQFSKIEMKYNVLFIPDSILNSVMEFFSEQRIIPYMKDTDKHSKKYCGISNSQKRNNRRMLPY